MKFLTQRNWSPYVSGVLIGLLQFPAVVFVDYTLGLSSAFVTVVKELYLRVVDHEAPHTLGATNMWQLGLAIGVAVGAFMSARFSGTKRPSIPTIWKNEMNQTSPMVRYGLSFVGGMLLIVGARLANGCTSGNGISGTSQLNASSWIVLIGMFISAVVVANLLRWMFKGR